MSHLVSILKDSVQLLRLQSVQWLSLYWRKCLLLSLKSKISLLHLSPCLSLVQYRLTVSEWEVSQLVRLLLNGVTQVLYLLLMLQCFVSLNKVQLLLSFVFLELLLVQHNLLAEILKELGILLSLLEFLRLLLLAIGINLTDYGGKQFFLISLAWIELDSLCEALSGASLNEGRQERIRHMIFLKLVLKRSCGIS